MNKQTMMCAIAIAGAVALGAATPLAAAPVLSSTAAINQAAPSSVIDVRNRGHRNRGHRNYRHSRNNGPGIALGILGAAGAAIAGENGYYGPGYYAQEPSYYGHRRHHQRRYYGHRRHRNW